MQTPPTHYMNRRTTVRSYWRITKYDPQYRDQNGSFTKQEWTAYSDIGKLYDNTQFDYNEYIKIENLYINAIRYFMHCCKISSLRIVSLEKSKKMNGDHHNDNNMISLFSGVK